MRARTHRKCFIVVDFDAEQARADRSVHRNFRLDLAAVGRQEVAVNWHEVPGSKLIRSKLDVITTSATMLRDMMCVRLCYLFGVWTVTSPRDLAAESKKRR